ncbi:MAG: hypothetical protein J5I41_09180 [Saprospiraceae bacterium]|nr:hypothetical protein [Saprospiraceae bacterium]
MLELDLFRRRLYAPNDDIGRPLHCPYGVGLDALDADESRPGVMACHRCLHPVRDTRAMEAAALVRVIREEPDTCLAVDTDHPAITIRFSGYVAG